MSRREATSRPGAGDPEKAQVPCNISSSSSSNGIPKPSTSVPPGRALLKTVAIYARVSTDKQEREETIGSQIDALKRAVDERGFELPPEFVFVDEGYTGARMARPALDRLRDLASEGAFEAVMVYCPDRLARQYAYQVVVVDELKRSGCEIIFLNHAFGTTPEEKMLLQIQGVFAEYERALIQERARRGRLFKARQGHVGWGTAAYGYRYIRKGDTTPPKLEIEEKEAEVVRQMYRWIVEEQLSTGAIAKRLNEHGVPTRKGRPSGWWQSTVVNILVDSRNKGEAYYNRTMVVDARHPRGRMGLKDLRPGNGRGQSFRPKEEWIPVRVPAIVDAETWKLAQAQLAQNRERCRRNNKRHEYLLRSLLICSGCERRMVGGWHGKSKGEYRCARRFPRNAPGSCDGRVLTAERIEKMIWDHVRQLLADPDLLKSHYEEGRGDPAIQSREEQERNRIERKIQGLGREVQRLIDAYQAEIIELPELTQRRTRIDEHGRMLRERLREIHNERADRENELRLLEGMEVFSASVQEALVDPGFEVKQKVLQLVVDRVLVEDSRVVIHHIIPAGPVRLQTQPQTPTREGSR
jgi:site-specific DNA recombinase